MPEAAGERPEAAGERPEAAGERPEAAGKRPEAAGELYGLDPAGFTAARDALAKALRAGGDRAAADQVKKLRRPPVTVWALNQVARHDPALITDVIDAGAGLRAATERAVTGDASGMRAAKSAERVAIDTAVAAAARYLEDADHPAGATARQRLAATLHAAEVDETVAALLAAGSLDQDRDAPGLGLELSVWPDLSPGEAPAGGAEAGGAERHLVLGREDGRSERLRAPEPGGPDGEVTSEPDGETEGKVGAPETGSRAAGRDGAAVEDEAERSRRARAHVSDLEDEVDRLSGRAARLAAQADADERRAAEARAAADDAERRAAETRAAADDAERRAAETRAEADRAAANSAATNEALARARDDLG